MSPVSTSEEELLIKTDGASGTGTEGEDLQNGFAMLDVVGKSSTSTSRSCMQPKDKLFKSQLNNNYLQLHCAIQLLQLITLRPNKLPL